MPKVIQMEAERGDESEPGDFSKSSHENKHIRNVTSNGADFEILAKRQVQVVRLVRITMILVLFLVACAVCLSVYFSLSNSEESDFETRFNDQATRVLFSFQANTAQVFDIIRGLTLSYTSQANIDSNGSWPMVTLPDFEARAENVLKVSNLLALLMFPKVSGELRSAWEAYSNANQGWLAEGLAYQQNVPASEVVVDPITPIIYKVEGLEGAPETGEGPFYPYVELFCDNHPWLCVHLLTLLYCLVLCF
jgi:hypothetical protein